jgi:hypothetical protein
MRHLPFRDWLRFAPTQVIDEAINDIYSRIFATVEADEMALPIGRVWCLAENRSSAEPRTTGGMSGTLCRNVCQHERSLSSTSPRSVSLMPAPPDSSDEALQKLLVQLARSEERAPSIGWSLTVVECFDTLLTVRS